MLRAKEFGAQILPGWVFNADAGPGRIRTGPRQRVMGEGGRKHSQTSGAGRANE